jgi:hypothetical protein
MTVNIETKTSLIVIAEPMALTAMTGRARGGSALRIFGNMDVVVTFGADDPLEVMRSDICRGVHKILIEKHRLGRPPPSQLQNHPDQGLCYLITTNIPLEAKHSIVLCWF